MTKLCLFGADPEVFVSVDKEILPAFTFLPSAKEVAKLNTKEALRQYGYFQPAAHPYWDGFQAEFATIPKKCRDEITQGVHQGLWAVRKFAKNKNPDARLDIRSVVEISREALKSAEQAHVNLACNPSLNVYGAEPIDIKDSRRLKYRFAGFHFHFGIDDTAGFHKDQDQIENTVKNLDATIGLIGVSMFENLDHPVRRKYYGRAGEFRLPSHGLEYRTLSSSVLIHPGIHQLLWDVAGRVVNLYTVKNYDKQLKKINKDRNLDYLEIKNIINSYDVEAARNQLLNQEKFLTEIFTMAYGYDPALIEFAWKTILRPVEKTVKDDETWSNLQTGYLDYKDTRFSKFFGIERDDMPNDDEFLRDRWTGESESNERERELAYA